MPDRPEALSGVRELPLESDAPLAPTEAQSPLVATSRGLEGPELLPVPALPLALSILRAFAGGHSIAAPEADVFGVRAPPVVSGAVVDGPATLAPLEPLAPGDGDCANEMLAVAVRAIKSGIDEKVFISPPREKLRT
jgi:hypothetical protein